ncbi:MAG: ATP-binding protein [Chloroherpetonaceae bacterium]
MQSRYELILESDLSEVRRVEGFVKTMCQDHHFEKNFVHDVMLLITEATNNAIMHGNKLDKTKRATLLCTIEGGYLTIEVSDEGSGFNPDEIPNPLAPENLLKPSGRGVFLIKNFAEQVDYAFSPSGTTLKIRVAIRSSEKSECE